MNLKAVREKLGLTQFEMAIKSGISMSMIQIVESGRAKNLRPSTRRKVAAAYGIDQKKIPCIESTAIAA